MPPGSVLQLSSKPIQLKPHGNMQNYLYFSSMPNSVKSVHMSGGQGLLDRRTDEKLYPFSGVI